jgi:hypothetical protein
MGIKMKKIVASLCLLGATMALAACDTTGMGYVDTQPPFTDERTVGTVPTASAPVASAEPVFEQKVTK